MSPQSTWEPAFRAANQVAELKFTIKFITPLLIHGVIHGTEPPAADHLGLAKALRGCWRFWFRAAVGNMVSDDELRRLESSVFGSAEEETGGAKFRMRVEPVGDLGDPAVIDLGLSRPATTKGYREGCEFQVSVLPRGRMTNDERRALSAAISLWGHLGAVGQRARRGFGSPVILSGKTSFNSPRGLEHYLRTVIEQTEKMLQEFLKAKGVSTATGRAPGSSACFTLGGLGQVAVGPASRGTDIDAVLKQVHGTNQCLKGCRDSCSGLGHAVAGRLASPVFLRLHKLDDGYCPVVTWSRSDGGHSDCARQWLLKLGFGSYLSGDPI
ncbi:MAG: hypothetical protein DRP27_09080 [Thermotogae bacterium]|nr:MAG: hypothetical protein DRP27_09080 [Thermotogota bacterium]